LGGERSSERLQLIYLFEDPDVAINQEEVQMIHKILEQFLGQYVLVKRRNLEEMLDRFVTPLPPRSFHPSLPSQALTARAVFRLRQEEG
jgi:hypothetical protein